MSLIGGLLGTDAAAADAARAAAESNRVNKEIYDQQRTDLSGYRDLGQTGLDQVKNNLTDLTGTFSADNFRKDPGYDFRMQEGMKALERSASARGNLMGGATGKAMTRYGQDYASNEYNNAYNRFNQDRDQRYGKLMDLVGTGQNAAAQTGAAGQNYAGSYGQNVTGAANASGAASMANGQALLTAGMMAASFSDRRLKKNITKLSQSQFKDVPTYSFHYKDERHGEGKQIGVMAQDLLEIDANHPAVEIEDGFYTVDYSMLEGA